MKENMKFTTGIDGSKRLIMESSNLEACIQYVLDGKIDSISINPFQGFHAESIEFLDRLSPVLKGLHIPQCDFEITVLNKLHQLESLGYEDNLKDTVDLSNFPNLKVLATAHSKRLLNIGCCNQLISLSLHKLNSSTKDLCELPRIETLKEFFLFQSTITSLEGIDRFENLSNLGLFILPKLSRIGGIAALAQKLENLEIESCKKIIDYETLREMKTLRKVQLFMAGQIPSLKFITSMPSLSILSFVQTKIIDGDLSYCEPLDQVAFDEKRHYNRRRKDFGKRIG